MRDRKLHNVTLIESTGWYPVASVWIQEWFDEELPNRIRVLGHRKPYALFARNVAAWCTSQLIPND
jgi:hypothetical protein